MSAPAEYPGGPVNSPGAPVKSPGAPVNSPGTPVNSPDAPVGSPVLAGSKAELAAVRSRLAGPVVLVPTMGALHHGHRALLRQARQAAGPAGSVVVSVFVNPLQFGPAEDYGRYPRGLEADLAVCAQEGAEVVFAPDSAEMYPAEPMIRVDPGPVGQLLEGASRPGFFAGVLTVVLKLFSLVRPDVAVFGQKDAQQLALVRQMSADFNLGVRIDPVAIVRDSDGLAVSSRNAYLSPAERSVALALSRALDAGTRAAIAGPTAVRTAAWAVLTAAATGDPPLQPDYLALVDPVTFTDVSGGDQGPALLLIAARVGTTRLIDNAQLMLGTTGVERHAADH